MWHSCHDVKISGYIHTTVLFTCNCTMFYPWFQSTLWKVNFAGKPDLNTMQQRTEVWTRTRARLLTKQYKHLPGGWVVSEETYHIPCLAALWCYSYLLMVFPGVLLLFHVICNVTFGIPELMKEASSRTEELSRTALKGVVLSVSLLRTHSTVFLQGSKGSLTRRMVQTYDWAMVLTPHPPN